MAADVDELADGLLQVDWCRDFERVVVHVVLSDGIVVGIEHAGRSLVGEDVGVGHGEIFREPFVVLLARVVVIDEGHDIVSRQGKTSIITNHPRMGQL